jgi:hypothetical protein
MFGLLSNSQFKFAINNEKLMNDQERGRWTHMACRWFRFCSIGTKAWLGCTGRLADAAGSCCAAAAEVVVAAILSGATGGVEDEEGGRGRFFAGKAELALGCCNSVVVVDGSGCDCRDAAVAVEA